MPGLIETIDTPYGRFSVDMVRDKKIGTRLKEGIYHQEDTLKLLEKFLTKDSVVVDVGAHIGTEAIPLSKIAAKVIAFEPSPETFAILKQNVIQNNSRVDARNKGLGSSAGYASIEKRSESNAGANMLSVGEGGIEISTLDREIDHADVIKIDIEGMELSAFEGGARLLEESRPVIFSEVNISALRKQGASPRKLQEFLRRFGYSLYVPLSGPTEEIRLGAASNLSLIALCIAPKAMIFKTGSAPFDVVAIHEQTPVPFRRASFLSTVFVLAKENLSQKIKRIRHI